MKSQPVLVISGILLSACGVAALFAPQELGAFLSGTNASSSSLAFQLTGAGLFALGFLDWTSRFSSIGGIYGRPLLLANFSFFFTTAAILARHATASGNAAGEWLITVISGLLALWYARFLFFPPKPVAVDSAS